MTPFAGWPPRFLVLAWALLAPTFLFSWPDATSAESARAFVVTTAADLWRVRASDSDRALLRQLEDLSIRDATSAHFTPFYSNVPHRFHVSGRLRERTPPVRIETETWFNEEGLRFGLSDRQIDAALKSIESEASPAHLARMGFVASGWTIRPSGLSGVVVMDLTVELALGGTKFRAPVTYRVFDAGYVRNGVVTPQDVMRFVASARAAPFYRALEPHAKRVDGALLVDGHDERLEMALTWDRPLPGGNALKTGGTLVMDMATGRTGFEQVALPLSDLARCGVAALEALAKRPDVAWLIAHEEPGAEAHVTVRPAGWIVRLRSGTWRLDLAVAAQVQVLVSVLPADALTDASARADADLRGFLLQAGHLQGPDAMLELSKSYPGVLLIEITAAQLALDRGNPAEGRARVQAAQRSAVALQKAWDQAGAAVARGDFEKAESFALQALRLCPSDTRLWAARRRLALAARDALAAPLPNELARWERVPYDVPRLMSRLRQLEKRVGLPVTPVASTPPAPVTSGAQLDLAGLRGWHVTSTEVEAPAAPAAPRRNLVRLSPSPAPDPALPTLEAVVVYPPVPAPPTTALLAGTLARLAALRVGTVPVLPRSTVSLWYNVLAPSTLLPALDAPSTVFTVPDALLDSLGPLRRTVLARGFREPTALVTFSAKPVGGVSTGTVLGLDVPALDQTLVLELAVPGGQLDPAGIRELLTPVFEPGGQPVLGRAELKARNGAVEVSFLPAGHEEVGLMKSLRRPTPFLSLSPGRLRIDQAALLGVAGSLRVQEW